MSTKKYSRAITLTVVLLFSGVAFSQPANLYTFGPDVEITEAAPDDGTDNDELYSSSQHRTAFRGDTVYVVWAENRASTPPTGNHIFFAKSTDRGQTFGSNVRVNSTAAGFTPSMRVDTAGIIYVAYNRLGDIYFTKSTDGGNSFTPAVFVVDSVGEPWLQERPAIAVNNKGHVFIAWIDYRLSELTIFTAASYDGGSAFLPSVPVNDTATPLGGDFDIGADDNNHVYVAWKPTDRRIFLSRSDDSGQTFPFRSVVTDLPTDSSIAGSGSPSIAVGGGSVGVAWQDRRFEQFTLRFAVSTNYGQTFSSSTRVDDDNDLSVPSNPQFPSLVWKSNVFWVTWRELRFDTSISDYVDYIYFSYSSNKGQTFAKNVRVFDTGGAFFFVDKPSLSVNEKGQAFAAWFDDRYDPSFSLRKHIFGAAGSPLIVKGDLNLDSLLTPADVVLELNAVFLQQAFPASFEAADVNCDTVLSPADVVLHLNATFMGDPFPCS
ncbi:MAG: glycoside hydrolase [candidate division Zixibacteria bacterium]|nr:glycoside hydrolase [candidate division Zixibacteria bacterium]MCI0531676.1 glycoside hydrolase [candidate division Zixibacteria bacterium]